MAKSAAFGVLHLGIAFGVGYALTGSVTIAGALTLSARTMVRTIAAGSLLLSVAAVIVTFSRAGFITLAVTVVMVLVALARRRAPAARRVRPTRARRSRAPRPGGRRPDRQPSSAAPERRA